MKKLKKNEKIGLALGGGAVLGAAHIGVLKALKEHDISISYVSGTSIGAFVSAFLAFEKTWEEIEDRLLVDGGIVENVPITPLEDMGAEVIIGVDLNAEHARKKPENIIEVLLRSFDFLIKTATELQTAEADILIKPDLSDFNMVDIDQADDLIEVGYKEAIKILQKVT